MNPPTLTLTATLGILGGLFFLQHHLGKSTNGEDVTDENLDDLAASIDGCLPLSNVDVSCLWSLVFGFSSACF